jgi:hypothetical protein
LIDDRHAARPLVRGLESPQQQQQLQRQVAPTTMPTILVGFPIGVNFLHYKARWKLIGGSIPPDAPAPRERCSDNPHKSNHRVTET